MGKHPKECFMLFSGINIYQPVQENVTFLHKQRICSESIPEETEKRKKKGKKKTPQKTVAFMMSSWVIPYSPN